MELRDITNEYSLLKSYKTVFIDNQSYELLNIYRAHERQFPIFTERVFALTANSPFELLKYVTRERLEDASAGRIFILERIDNNSDVTRTRLYFVWVSPKQVAQFVSGSDNALHVNASVLFHPLGGLDKYPKYWIGDIDPLKVPNFLELGIRYLCKEKQSVTQNFCAVQPSNSANGTNVSANKKSTFAVMLVVPVSSSNSFSSLGNPTELQDVLQEIAARCYMGITSKPIMGGQMTLDRVSVAGYSRSGVVLRRLLDSAGMNERFMRMQLKEIYAFDVILDERDAAKKLVKTKQQGYDEFWGRLKAWQGDDSDKKIRLYSAEPSSVGNVYSEMQSALKLYGGGYHNKSVGFSAFNKSAQRDGSKYSGLIDGYEIYSTDNSRSLVVFPSGNALVYLSSEKLVNPGGFAPGGDYEPGLEGHSWFVSRLQSHALFHSGF